MAEDLLLSYILPCYNTGPFIRQCIESLYKQGMDESTFEVIFVNNATEDNSEEIVFDIKKEHSNLVYIKLDKNICAGGAYNTGLKVAKGRYIQFVDSDDYLKENRIFPLLDRMESNHLDVLFFNIESFRGESELTSENELQYNGNFPDALKADDGNDYLNKALSVLPFSVLPVPAYRKMIRACVLKENNIQFTQTTVGCDYLHNLHLLSFAKRTEVITDKIYMFRYNPNGVTKSRISAPAIVFALTNYYEAYAELSKTTFDPAIKECIKKNIISLINSYIGAMKYIDDKGRNLIINSIQRNDIVKTIPLEVFNRLLIQNGFFSRKFFTSSLFYKLKAFRNIL